MKNYGYDIIFCWIPGHVGIHGNEAADTAAKQATIRLDHCIPFSDIKLKLRTLYDQKLQELWNAQINNKLHSVKTMVSHWPHVPVRRLDVVITRLRIGHTRLTHRHLLFGDDSPVCSFCNCHLTVHHILTSCTAFTHLYVKIFNCTSPSLNNILGESPHPDIFKFLKTRFSHHIWFVSLSLTFCFLWLFTLSGKKKEKPFILGDKWGISANLFNKVLQLITL